MIWRRIVSEYRKMQTRQRRELEVLEAPGALSLISRAAVGVMALVTAVLFAVRSPDPQTTVLIGVMALVMAARIFMIDYYKLIRPVPRPIIYMVLSALTFLFITLAMRELDARRRLIQLGHFLMMFIMLAYITRMRYSEYRALFVSSLMLMAASIYVDPGVTLLFRLPIFIFVSVIALGIFSFLRARAVFNEKHTGGKLGTGYKSDEELTLAGAKSAFGIVVMTIFTTVIVGVSVFFLFPRPSIASFRKVTGLDRFMRRNGMTIDGTPQISFNDYTEYGRDDTEIMSVRMFRVGREADGPIFLNAFRIRSMAMSRYDPMNNVWLEPKMARKQFDPIRLSGDRYTVQQIPFLEVASDRPASDAFVQKIRFSDRFSPGSRWWGLPETGRADAIRVSNTLRRDVEGNVMVWGIPRQAGYAASQYTVRFRNQHVSARRLERATVGRLGEIAPHYLYTYGAINANAFRLYRTWTRGARSPYQKAKMLEEVLGSSGRYAYDLDIRDNFRNGPLDVLNVMLLETRKGHCALYASAMAMLLRADGIPTRVVSGYHVDPGTWDPVEKIYHVRRLDAHAWVEVFFQGDDWRGWVPFEPTPGNYAADDPRGDQTESMAPDGGGSGRKSGGENGRDASGGTLPDAAPKSIRPSAIRKNVFHPMQTRLDRWWYRNILGYTRDRQRRMYGRTRRAIHDWFSPSDAGKRLLGLGVGWWILAGVLIAGFLWIFPMMLKKRIRKARGERSRYDSSVPALRFYVRLMTFLRKIGFRRPAYQTPAAFADRVTRGGSDYAGDVQRLTRVFEEAVYGGRKLSPDEDAALDETVMKMQNAYENSVRDGAPPGNESSPE